MKRISILIVFSILSLTCNDKEGVSSANATDEIAIISTDFGDIHVVLYDETPLHKENFLKLAKEGFYDSTTFHRVMSEFMIQGGDPNSKDDIPFNDGQGGPGYTVEAEFNSKFYHKKGALAAARLGDQQNPEKRSSGSQFYIVQGRPVSSLELNQILQNLNNQGIQEMLAKYVQAPENIELLQSLQQYQMAGQLDSVQTILARIKPIATAGYIPKIYTEEQRGVYSSEGGAPFLDGNYTVFGEVIRGLSVVDSIAIQNTNPADRPFEDIVMSVRVEQMSRDKITSEYGYYYEN